MRMISHIIYIFIITSALGFLYHDSLIISNHEKVKDKLVATIEQLDQKVVEQEWETLEQKARADSIQKIHRQLIQDVGGDTKESVEVRATRLTLYVLKNGHEFAEELPAGVAQMIYSDMIEAADRLIYLAQNFQNERLVIEERDTLQLVPVLKPETRSID